MSYTEICEGELKCSDYDKCVKQYEKTGKDKCIKKEQFKTYACNGDNCHKCNNRKDCTLILKKSESLHQDQCHIQELLDQIRAVEVDIDFITSGDGELNVSIDQLRTMKEELTEELREYRLKEHKKLKVLRRKLND